MFNLIAKVLAWFYELWPSFGMSIVLLTFVVMVILTPLTLKGTRALDAFLLDPSAPHAASIIGAWASWQRMISDAHSRTMRA